MPAKKVQGQSGNATEIKQRGLSYAFRVGLAVTTKYAYRYFHFDLHAGGGYNEDVGCIGSPLAFLNEARRVNCTKYFAGFCDRDDAQIKSLLNRPEIDHDRCRLFHGDNAALLGMVPDIIRHYGENPNYAIGSVLSDPNGADMPIDALAWLARKCPRIDIILHWNSTIVKRLRGGIKPDQPSLADAIDRIDKRVWIIREHVGIHQFTMLIGRNWRFGDWQSKGFHYLDTPKGQDVLERCTLPKHEIERMRTTAQETFL